MPAGVPTDESVVAEFRALYLHSLNAAKCARELDIPERTGRDLAARLEEEPSFAEDRRKLRAGYLDRLTMMRMSVAETAHDRFENGSVYFAGGGENVTVIDKRPDYGRLVLEAEKNAQSLAKFEAEKAGEIGIGAALVIIEQEPPDAPDPA